MTPSQIELAQKYQEEQRQRFGFEESNVEFRLGFIEDLKACGIEDNSIDLVVSNCVVNLSPFKDLVLSEVYRVLKPGGELYFSDVYSDRRMTDELRNDPVLVGECLGGALYEKDFRDLMAQVGWPTFVHTVVDDMHVGALDLQTKLGFMSFKSCTVRAIKTDGLETEEEDYGQVATYLGGMPEMPRYFDYSNEIRFKKGKAVAISGNTARMLVFIVVALMPCALSRLWMCMLVLARSTRNSWKTPMSAWAIRLLKIAWASLRFLRAVSSSKPCR